MTTNNSSISTISESNGISFRNKFRNLLTEGNIEAATFAFWTFCNSFTYEAAIHYLWNMTYLERDIKLEEDDLFWCFQSENIKALRNELRFQYNLLHPGFLEVQLPAECQEAFNTLEKKSDCITAHVVCKHCNSHTDMEESTIQTTLGLLSSNKENEIFRGIRNLNFNKEASNYLKPYHTQIHDLLEAFNEAKHKEEGETTPEAESQQETTELAPAMEVKVNNEEVVGGKKEALPANLNFRTLTAEEILEYKLCFEGLFNPDTIMMSLTVLLNSGFDLNEVVMKQEKIHAMLTAINAINLTA